MGYMADYYKELADICYRRLAECFIIIGDIEKIKLEMQETKELYKKGQHYETRASKK